jgi:eIF-2B alpha/beta/delta-like uncharacterized protein
MAERGRGGFESDNVDLVQALTDEAQKIQDEDLAANRHMGDLGAGLLGNGVGVLTHCNTGSLATAGFGTALGVIRAGFGSGRIARVFAGETRPWQQGARLTMWELVRDHIPAKLIADSAAAHLMSTGAVQWVIVGVDASPPTAIRRTRWVRNNSLSPRGITASSSWSLRRHRRST